MTEPTAEQVERMAERLWRSFHKNPDVPGYEFDLLDQVNRKQYLSMARYVLSLLLPLQEALNEIKCAHSDCEKSTPEEHEMFHIADAALARLRKEGLL